MKKKKKKAKVKKKRTNPTTNPNGANQYLLDPRQKVCWDTFIDPTSDTFSNAYKSARKAGYTHATALHITTEVWFLEKVRRMNMLGKAERVLDEMLDLPIMVEAALNRYAIKANTEDEDEDGYSIDPEPQAFLRTDPALVKIKQDTAKFVAERLGKDDGYSSRNEHTGKNGAPLVEVDEETKEKSQRAITEYLAANFGGGEQKRD